MVLSKCGQVKEYICGRIDVGELEAHAVVPSLNDLSAKFGINRNTAAKALNELASEGRIYQVRGVGSFVSPASERGRSRNLAILVYDVSSPVFSKIIRYIGDSCHEHNYSLISCSLYASWEKEREVLKDLVDRGKVDGLIVFPSGNSKEEVSLLRDIHTRGIPVICHSLLTRVDPVSTLGFDYDAGIIKSAEHLFSHGYRCIGLVNGADGSGPVMQRYYGYRMALDRLGLAFREDWVFTVHDLEERYGYESADLFIDHPDRPQALVIASDEVAIGVINRMHERGLSVPGDVALTAGGNIDLGAHPLYSLTTVAPDFKDMGRRLTARMMEMIANPGLPAAQLLFEQRLIVRNSSGGRRDTEECESLRNNKVLEEA